MKTPLYKSIMLCLIGLLKKFQSENPSEHDIMLAGMAIPTLLVIIESSEFNSEELSYIRNQLVLLMEEAQKISTQWQEETQVVTVIATTIDKLPREG